MRTPTASELLQVWEDGFERSSMERSLSLLAVASRDGQPIAAEALGDDTVTVLEASMAAADPMADIEIALRCPACSHGWTAAFDIATFLWSEIHAWAQRLLLDVHKLARAYGWS